MKKSLAILILSLTAYACAKDSESPTPMNPPPIGDTSYLRDIQPIIERSCVSCHRPDGIGPFSLDTPEKVIALSAIIKPAVESRRMPPFMAAQNCTPYKHDIRLSDEEIALISKWVDDGSPMGDAEDEQHAENPRKAEINRDVLMDIGGPFDATIMESDHYRCFILDPQLTEDVDVTGYEVIPDNDRIVHHALAYAIPANRMAEVQMLDDNDPGLGYTCFSNNTVSTDQQIAAWVPGQVARQLPDGIALRIEAGTKILIQIHYNLLASGDKPPLDNTQLALQTQSPGQANVARTYSVLQPNLDIPADTKDIVAENTITIPRGGDGMKIHAITGHMHQLGQAFRMEVKRKDGTKECLLDIPDWDFDWQQSFELAEAMTLNEGDELKVRCVFDNTQANQPIIDGEQVQSRDVQWGEGSLDEMCIGYLLGTLR